MNRVDHADGSATFELPLRIFRVPPSTPREGPPEATGAPLTADEAARREKRRILEVQLSTLPADGNIGPTGRRLQPDDRDLLRFRRQITAGSIRSALRNLEKLRELDDDPDLEGLQAALNAWEIHLGG